MKRIAKYRMPLLLTLFAGVVLASGAVLAQADAVATEVECDEVPADAEDAVEPVDPECLRCGGSTVAAPGGPIVKTSTISGDDCQTQVDAAADAACRAAGKPGDCAGHCAGGGSGWSDRKDFDYLRRRLPNSGRCRGGRCVPCGG